MGKQGGEERCDRVGVQGKRKDSKEPIRRIDSEVTKTDREEFSEGEHRNLKSKEVCRRV